MKMTKYISEKVNDHGVCPLMFMRFILYLISVVAISQAQGGSEDMSLVEHDWMKQAKVLALPSSKTKAASSVPTWADAAGAVDGVKDGKYAFHTGHEADPWWQVDLEKEVKLDRIIVYNRLDYAPGLHNADNILILLSSDGQNWRQCYDNKGIHFGGISGTKPLEVRFEKQRPVTRYVRLQIPSSQPIFFHLDEVEIYGADDPEKNIALKKPVDQSSISQWSTAKWNAISTFDYTRSIESVIKSGRLLADDLRAEGVDVDKFDIALKELSVQAEKLTADISEEAKLDLYLKARTVTRRLVFSNPLLNFDELLFVKRYTQETYPDVCLNHMPWVSRPGGDICIVTLKDHDKMPLVRNLLNGSLGPGHVHGMDLSWDGRRVVFGYSKAKSDQAPEGWLDRRTNYDLRRQEEPTHIFETGIDGKNLRQVTDGQWSDLDPAYAPNGDIVFVSERCECSLQCNEYDKDETSCNLYSCRPDGSNIKHLSVSKDGDYLPHTFSDGTIGYTRWEYQERGWAHIQSVWFVRPDGTGADALFKQHLNDPWALEDMRSIPFADNNKLVAIATGHHTLAAGPVVVITPSVGMNDSSGIKIVTPDVYPPEGGMSGTVVQEGGVRDFGGFYMTPWPLSPKYFLVSYSYSSRQTEPAGYGIYLIDIFGNKELIYRDPDISCFIPIPLRARQRPPILHDSTDESKGYATCYVANIVRGVEGAAKDRIRYLRVSSRLQWPYDNKYGGQRYAEKAWPHNWTPAKVIGTVPVEPDGSAYFRVPVDTPVYFQLLDENHMELRRMRSFISFQPGETRGCVGCHETRAEAPVITKVPSSLRMEPRIPTPPPWGDRPISFLRDVQPILNRHCIECHSGLHPEAELDFSSGLTAQHNRAYDTILAKNLVSHSNVNEDAAVTQPMTFGSHLSKIVNVLKNTDHKKRLKLDQADWLKLVTWIDANAPYHDEFINKRPEEKPYDLTQDMALVQSITAIHKKRCNSCHTPQEITRLDWIDLYRPEKSLFLTAPLSHRSGGTERCGQAVYKDCSDKEYSEVLRLVNDSVSRAIRYPRRDLKFISRAAR